MLHDSPDRFAVSFDDERVVVNAGIMLAGTLGRRLGRRRSSIGRRARRSAGRGADHDERPPLRSIREAYGYPANGKYGPLDVRRPYQQPAWRALSAFVVSRDGSCQERSSTSYLAAHHVIPRAEDGADHPSRLVAVRTCHRAKTAHEHRRITPIPGLSLTRRRYASRTAVRGCLGC